MKSIDCGACGGSMRIYKRSVGNASGIAAAILVFLVGVILCATGVGALIGVPLILVSLFMGGRRESWWRCTYCGHALRRL